MDELERRIRAARPLSGNRDLPLSDRAKRELADLVLADPVHDDVPRRPRRGQLLRRVGVALGAGAMLIAGAIIAAPLLSSQPALPSQPAEYAATPALLTITPTTESANALLADMSRRLYDDEKRSPRPTETTIQLQAWTLEIGEEWDADESVIVPEDVTITRTDDGGRRTVATAGQPLDRHGQPSTASRAPRVGDLLWEESWGPGEFRYLFNDDFPSRAVDVGAYLAAPRGLDQALSASDSIQAVSDLLTEQQLTATEEAILLEYFAGLPDLTAEGTTTDRLGRKAVVFLAEDADRPEYRRYLIVSPDTGRILATEVVYVGNTRADIAPRSIVSYLVWR